MNSVVVTGAAGFLGRHLCEYFLARDFAVFGVDNFSTGSKENIKVLNKHEYFHFIEGDICELDVWSQLCGLSRVQYVFHFASPASPRFYMQSPLATMRANSVGLQLALDYATNKEARLIFASSSEVYGNPEVHPQPESYFGNVNPTGLRSCYTEAKRFGEALLFSFNQEFETQHGVVRLFNSYGPYMSLRDGRVITEMLLAALAQREVVIHGTGAQTRSFCYADDTIAGIVAYANSKLSFPLNIGNPNEISILDLILEVEKATGKKIANVRHIESLANDPLKRCPDLNLCREHLPHWQPRVSLAEGLKITAQWMTESF
ncbi:MAG: NAD-dependent epimerase/dehydratase family protein [Bdellovibrionia bacterium]